MPVSSFWQRDDRKVVNSRVTEIERIQSWQRFHLWRLSFTCIICHCELHLSASLLPSLVSCILPSWLPTKLHASMKSDQTCTCDFLLGLGYVTTHWHQQKHQGYIKMWGLGLCHSTLTPAKTQSYIKMWGLGLSQHTDTSKNIKATLKWGDYRQPWFSSLHNGICFKKMEINPPKMASGCPCGRVINLKNHPHSQSSHLHLKTKLGCLGWHLFPMNAAENVYPQFKVKPGDFTRVSLASTTPA